MPIQHSRNRLQTLSDGIFAFASTLLAVNIGVEATAFSISEMLPNIIIFAVGFFAMATIWKLHYNYSRRTQYIDNYIIFYTLVLLFTVIIFIFPLKSLLYPIIHKKDIEGYNVGHLFQLYSTGFIFIFGCFSLLYYQSYKKDNASGKNHKLLFFARHFLVFVIIGILSFLLATFKIGLNFGLPGFIYALIGLLTWWNAVHFKKKYSIE